jgi:prepilin-type N-terminal cleavage/methylation domain-containing protein
MKHALFFSTPNSGAPRAGRGARGFTLIELMVVLAVAAVVAAITLGGFKEMREGNKRVSCQTNLSQIYQAARLYAADEGGKFPYYQNPCTSATFADDQIGIGLWALYTFPKSRADADFSTIAPVGSQPLERYLRSTKSLHCPSDQRDVSELLYKDAAKTEFNPYYLSYQTCDDGDATPGVPGVATYATQRVGDTTDSDWQRQLLHYSDTAFTNFVSRQPTGDTVVAYCIFHRDQRDMDNVLFYDGSIQLRPKATAFADNWRRAPKPPQ